uniref:Uncharacterized protein n=1 Tax=Megaviridae environmental sample TaxID=1737588 RepID=A0A5J6VHM6_9VIRU|nr:MAG: hypothetical protein [Megaviridae environmental sample]
MAYEQKYHKYKNKYCIEKAKCELYGGNVIIPKNFDLLYKNRDLDIKLPFKVTASMIHNMYFGNSNIKKLLKDRNFIDNIVDTFKHVKIDTLIDPSELSSPLIYKVINDYIDNKFYINTTEYPLISEQSSGGFMDVIGEKLKNILSDEQKTYLKIFCILLFLIALCGFFLIIKNLYKSNEQTKK